AHLTEEKNELWLTVVVNDTGKGISETHQKDLFSKYFQASPGQGYTGTGLGLYICRQIVEKQGGKINASSIQGKGSKFIFEIPFKKYEGDGPVQKKIVTDDEVLKGKKVLLVDDNEINLMLNAMILGKKGMIVKKAFNGLDAIKLLEEEGFDVLISDIHMPLMGGYELLEHIKTGNKKFSSIPVILLSGDESGLPSEGNVHPYKKLVKPVSGKQIGDTLSELFSTKIL
ncbi:MAG TPA: ATP-binding protein, partial [Panacibacter sp.]|nr:ATP-binding protein [Panacibacter sp.]